MTLNLEQEITYSPEFDLNEIARSVINEILDQEECPYESQVELLLCDDATIRQINQEQRQIDRVTDVLSFPMVPFEAPCDYDFLDTEEGDDCFDPDSGELLLGDIVICVPRMKEQAVEYGHSEKREYAFLIAHSMLHLLGYDHMVPEEAEVMFAKQEQALKALGITRE